VTDWTVHAARLADELTTAGKLWSAPWQAAVRAVPRHELVPVHYQRVPGTDQWIHTDTTDDLDLIYSNTALFVLPDGLSSTSMPALMTRMLEALDIHDGHDVLEIGAGTGYNAALLSHRLGDQHVFAIDIEPSLIRLARERLARIGYHPTLVTADGANGLPEHAPYDRIIATCSVPTVPWPWVEQTREGGLILADIKLAPLAGNLVLLRRTATGAQGRFDRTYGNFMAIRRSGETYSSPRPHRIHRDHTTARTSTSTLDTTRPWEHSVLWFLAHFHLPPGISFGLCGKDTSRPPTTTFLSTADGSWCEIDEPSPDGTHQVREAGPHQLWRIIEDTHATWLTMDQPGWERFGLTTTATTQQIWLDEPHNVLRNSARTASRGPGSPGEISNGFA
jgi:protein-L-isoaspartate(D-aspartate) O-methyltransferase